MCPLQLDSNVRQTPHAYALAMIGWGIDRLQYRIASRIHLLLQRLIGFRGSQTKPDRRVHLVYRTYLLVSYGLIILESD